MRSKVFFPFIAFSILMIPSFVAAHCDSLAGPVIADARLALETQNVTPVLKWVREEDQDEIRNAFARTVQVRSLSPESKTLADQFFFETVVRIHRISEGESYTGLKPAALDLAFVQADRSIQQGSIDEVVKTVDAAIDAQLRRRFAEVMEKKKTANRSVEDGRAYVKAYVHYLHFVEELLAEPVPEEQHH